LGLLAALVVSCGDKNVNKNEDETLTISSSSFTANAPLPAKHSCDGKPFGEGVSPELHWTAGPKAVQSYAIVFKDRSLLTAVPDHAYHWMIWNIPDSIKSLSEGLASDTVLPGIGGAHQVSAGPAGGGAYLGPCPSWQHYCSAATPAVVDTYSFTIYAFDTKTLTLPAKTTSDPTNTNYVRQAEPYFIQHAIATAELKTTSGAIPTSIPFSCGETITLGSSSFTANGALPAKYSCDGKPFGEGVAPELHWSAAPDSTKSYAIVVKDLSLLTAVPDHAFHWMIWNIPSSIKTLPEGLAGDTVSSVMGGAHQVSAGPAGGGAYLGPCPSWQHFCSAAIPAVVDTYSFTVYAFNKTLTLPAKITTDSTNTNYVRQIEPFFIANAIAKAELKTTSGAVPDSLTFPCP
jgi:phosphatidylethanolamine-binding protein (PEBP) family uncharacterized protein